MSAIYFHTQDEGDAELRGSERAHMSIMVTDVACSVIPHDRELVLSHMDPAIRRRRELDYPGREALFHNDLKMMLSAWSETPFFRDVNGRGLMTFSLLLNTVLAMGNDPLCLMARLHAQCEIHAYVEGEHRAWLAGIIDDGLAEGLYRREQGWMDVAALLRNRNDAPVVTSFSVTGGFPNSEIADWTPPMLAGSDDEEGEPNYDAWYELPDGEQWGRGLRGLRMRETQGSGLELKPENLRYRFRHDQSLFDVFNGVIFGEKE